MRNFHLSRKEFVEISAVKRIRMVKKLAIIELSAYCDINMEDDITQFILFTDQQLIFSNEL